MEEEHLAAGDNDEVNDQAIIDVLARLHPSTDVSISNVDLVATEGHDSTILADETDDILAGWTAEQLRAEVLRLRRAARGQGDVGGVNGHGAEAEMFGTSMEPQVLEASGSTPVNTTEKPPRKARNKRKRADMEEVKPKTRRDEETGKRLEKGRRIELARAVRMRMRAMMGIGLDDPMPPPSEDSHGASIPNWHAGLNDPSNLAFEERAATGVMDELRDGVWPKVPPEDMDPDIVRSACRTALLNFTKSYLARADPVQQARKERYAKHRRRWARKDLKQKRRAKAASDPAFGDQPLHPTALHIDYMSSEYSSAGEDSDDSRAVGDEQLDGSLSDKIERRAAQWAEVVRQATQTASSSVGWAEGLGEKVLEVRTPLWRSPQLNNIYARLDAIAALQSSARSNPATSDGDKARNTRPGHVAPSHRRFTLPNESKRRGKRPKDDGEGWMWSTGAPGIWPTRSSEELSYQGVGGMDGEDGDVARWADEVEAEVGTRGLVEVIEGIGT